MIELMVFKRERLLENNGFGYCLKCVFKVKEWNGIRCWKLTKTRKAKENIVTYYTIDCITNDCSNELLIAACLSWTIRINSVVIKCFFKFNLHFECRLLYEKFDGGQTTWVGLCVSTWVFMKNWAFQQNNFFFSIVKSVENDTLITISRQMPSFVFEYYYDLPSFPLPNFLPFVQCHPVRL